MNLSISHDRGEESPDAKARWFQSLTVEERMQIFCSVIDLAVQVTPSLLEGSHAQPIAGRVQVISTA